MLAEEIFSDAGMPYICAGSIKKIILLVSSLRTFARTSYVPSDLTLVFEKVVRLYAQELRYKWAAMLDDQRRPHRHGPSPIQSALIVTARH